MNNLSNPMFHDEAKARQWLEAQVWPNGPVCPHCGESNVTVLHGKAHRPGLFQCNSCRRQFTVTVGTLFERSRIPLTKWLMAIYLLSASKKGISTNQLSRMLGLPYKTAWFMTHRIREAMKDDGDFPLGGPGKAVEADETYLGGRQHGKNAKGRQYSVHDKMKVVGLVERGGIVRSFHVDSVNSKTIRNVLVRNVDRSSRLMTDEAKPYWVVGKEYAEHGQVRHRDNEYVRGDVFTNTIEGFFSIFKRGMKGVYQHCGEHHLNRYLAEFDFRYNTRHLTDVERAIEAAKGIVGKRLTYRRPGYRQATA